MQANKVPIEKVMPQQRKISIPLDLVSKVMNPPNANELLDSIDLAYEDLLNLRTKSFQE